MPNPVPPATRTLESRLPGHELEWNMTERTPKGFYASLIFLTHKALPPPLKHSCLPGAPLPGRCSGSCTLRKDAQLHPQCPDSGYSVTLPLYPRVTEGQATIAFGYTRDSSPSQKKQTVQV